MQEVTSVENSTAGRIAAAFAKHTMSSRAENQESSAAQFIKRNAGLTTVPAKVMVIADLEVLDLSNNEVEVVPKGLFPNITCLKTLDLSHNAIRALPDDIAALKSLEVLAISHNSLTALPDALYSLTCVRDVNASYNQIEFISDGIGTMEGLHVLNLAGNRLRSIPSDVGFLGLKQLNISDNPDLHIPPHVLQCGFKAVMSYLQVIGEQHQLVSHHLAAFTARLTELQDKHGLALGAMEDDAAVALRVKVAQRLGIFSCSHCRLAALPAALEGQDALQAVQVADLSHNRLKALPLKLLQGMARLLVLNISGNTLKTLPEALSLSAVAVLDLSFNKLSSLPADMGTQLPALQQLYLANNYLTALPDSLALAPLQDVFLSENAFEAVPQVLGRCSGLAKLSLAACQLAVLGDELQGLHELRFLDISFNELKCLPSSMSSLSGLAALNLGFNPLGTFPEALCSLSNLKEMNLDQTGISSFPAGIGNLRLLEGLQADGCPLVSPFSSLYAKDPLLLVRLHDTQLLSLDLSEVGLEEVPVQLLQLTRLTSLDLFKNSIKDLPVGLGELRQLQQLTLKGNPLRQPYLKLMDAKGELALLAFLRPEGSAGVLDLEGCGFEGLPKEVWELPGRSRLVGLQLTNNRLRGELPQELSGLMSLTQLVLDNNLLRSLPGVVLSLTNLAVLMASGNSITYLPEALGSAQQLQALILHSNQLMQLPDSITSLTNLRALGLTSNRLWQLPAGITACSALRLLDCSHNLLSRLPAGMGRLAKLRSLKLTHNKMCWVPVDELRELPGLLELHLVGNQFMVDVEMNASGAAAVQQLLAAIANSPAGDVPPALPSYSRNPSSIISNVNSYSPSVADSSRCHSPARSRFNDQPASQDAPGTFGKAGSGATGREGRMGHGVVWDDLAGCSSTSSQFSSAEGGSMRSSGTGAAAGTGRVQASSDNAVGTLRYSTDGHLGGVKLSSSDGGAANRSTDGALTRKSLEGCVVRHSEDGAVRRSVDGARPSVRFTDEPADEQPGSAELAGVNSSSGPAHRGGAAAEGSDGGSTGGRRHSADGAYRPSVHFTDEGVLSVPQHMEQPAAGADNAAAVSEQLSSGQTALAGTATAAGQLNAALAAPTAAAAGTAAVGAGTAAAGAGAAVAKPAAQQHVQSAANAEPAKASKQQVGREETGKLTAHGIPLASSAQPAAATSSKASSQQPGALQHAGGFKLQAAAAAAAVPQAGPGGVWQSSSWDKVPLMDIPRIIKALTDAPPPPPPQQTAAAAGPGAGEAGAVRRPQNKARFRRVIEQTSKAMAALELMAAAGAAAPGGDSGSSAAARPAQQGLAVGLPGSEQ